MGKKRPKRIPAPPGWPKRLHELRVRLNLTQAEAAAKLRVTVRAWNAWENGKKEPSPPFALLLTLFCDHHDLF